jgi:glycolate oxidase
MDGPNREKCAMIAMPEPDRGVLARRGEIVEGLRRIVPGEGVIDHEKELRAFESDGLTAYRQPPMVAVLPETTAQVREVMRYCAANRIKVVPRGAGTSLSGGALPLADGVLLGMGKFNKILEIDVANRCVVTQPGVTNLGITHAVQGQGLYYAPDPSSQIACTIGGNVAENSGGVHCLKYGLTTNNVIGVEIVTIEGEIVRLGGKHFDSSGYDLLGIMVGSEGMLGVVTEVTVRILPKPPGARALLIGFATVEGAGDCVAEVIGSGIIPGGMEIMDRPAVAAAEAFVHAGYPLDCEALMIVEVDGCEAEVDHLVAQVEAIAERNGATSCRASQSEEERLLFWAGRKAAFPAVGRISPDYYCMDGTIPRREIGRVLEQMKQMQERFGLRVANVFHAGDGNLHPLILYDANKPGELERAEAFGADILRLCVQVGGVLTGEHGVGVEKRDLMDTMFNEVDLNQQQRLKCAFDSDGLLNPGKVFPQLCRCAELGRMHVHAGRVAFPDLPRF